MAGVDVVFCICEERAEFIRIQHTDCIVKCCKELLCGPGFYCIRSYIINFGLNVLQRCQEMLDIFRNVDVFRFPRHIFNFGRIKCRV